MHAILYHNFQHIYTEKHNTALTMVATAVIFCMYASGSSQSNMLMVLTNCNDQHQPQAVSAYWQFTSTKNMLEDEREMYQYHHWLIGCRDPSQNYQLVYYSLCIFLVQICIKTVTPLSRLSMSCRQFLLFTPVNSLFALKLQKIINRQSPIGPLSYGLVEEWD